MTKREVESKKAWVYLRSINFKDAYIEVLNVSYYRSLLIAHFTFEFTQPMNKIFSKISGGESRFPL
jgi:hypothetical protein